MTTTIELFDKTYTGGTGFLDSTEVTLIAECNQYDDYGKLTRQFSRSPFTFPSSMTDEQIIASLRNNEYSGFFY